MPLSLKVGTERFPIAGTFTISRGSKTEAEVVVVALSDGTATGRGECVPYARYGESIGGVVEAIEAIRGEIERGLARTELLAAMKPGAARNAIDCALWDLEAKASGKPVSQTVCRVPPRPIATAFTISLGTPQAMAESARAAAHRPILKIKVGTSDDQARIEAVVRAAPRSRLILDANEGWSEDNIRDNLLMAARFGVALVEQPLPAGRDAMLRDIPHPVPLCADESVHTADGLAELSGRYDFINIKLDKTGGLTAALDLRDRARQAGFGVMVGCMVGTSLSMAPAVLLAQEAEFVDLDGPLLLARDREPGLRYEGSLVSAPSPALWG